MTRADSADSRLPALGGTDRLAELDRPADPPGVDRLTWVLVSHTNVGKTTLARTLLRRDIGEVFDRAHVTEEAESHLLVAAEAGTGDTGDTDTRAELYLSDTPGFGDSARLLGRLRNESRPMVWFVQQTWDRFTDRPFWSSQQAVLEVRERADFVLYLVNATEEPDEAGYVDLELELLDWMGVPVLLLLNQTGDTSFRKDVLALALDRWRRHTARFGVVGGVIELDAFDRCWVEESRLFETVESLLPAEQQPTMARLRRAWNERNLETLASSVAAIARYLGRAASDREPLPSRRPSKEERDEAMEALARRLVEATGTVQLELLGLHGLEGEAATEIDRQLDAFDVEGDDTLDPERSALLGGVVSGALGGLAADIMTGGLSLGGGMIAGAILGALGGAGLARGYELAKGDKLPEVVWSAGFLERLLRQSLLRYLAVAHFGRGRGEFRHAEASRQWQAAVEDVLRRGKPAREGLWKRAAAASRPSRVLAPVLDTAIRDVLVAGYPDAADLLDRSPPPGAVSARLVVESTSVESIVPESTVPERAKSIATSPPPAALPAAGSSSIESASSSPGPSPGPGHEADRAPRRTPESGRDPSVE